LKLKDVVPPDLDSLQLYLIQLLAVRKFHQGPKLCGLEMFEDHQNGLNFKVNSMKSKDTRVIISNIFVIV
jgi:hypothetical protein